VRILPLARSVVDPAVHRRGEPLDALASLPTTRVVLLHEGHVATSPDGARLDLWEPSRLAMLGPVVQAEDGGEARAPSGAAGQEAPLWLFLGELDGAVFLALILADLVEAGGEVADVVGAFTDCTWSALREVGHLLDDRDSDLATTAVALSEWHRRSRHCPRCGAATHAELGGWVRRCPADGGEEYPRTDAAVIMAVTDDADRILLAHGARWAERRFSMLAGFVEPGESLETAVRREVAEEVGVQVDEVTYVSSQPWPFPTSLMVAFRAHATTSDLVCDEQEVTEARWFTRDELARAVRDGQVTLPMCTSVALALIEEWFGGPLEGPQQSVASDS
jgi:NAD+ diphosphatase